jgi:hypothetical protein
LHHPQTPTDPDAQAPRHRWPGVVLGGAALWLAVQLLVPLSAVLWHPSEARTDFSWDMFATRRSCKPCHLLISRRGERPGHVQWNTFFRSPYHVARARNRQRLPLLARHLCRQEQAAGHDQVRVFVECTCRYNDAPRPFDLDPLEGADYCGPQGARYD